MEDDDNSDEDIGKQMPGLSYDSDDKNEDEELVGSGNSGNELINLDSGDTSGPSQRRAANIPKLSGPN